MISKAAGNVEVSGFAGFALRRDPDVVDISNSMRWGVGVWGVRSEARSSSSVSCTASCIRPMTASCSAGQE